MFRIGDTFETEWHIDEDRQGVLHARIVDITESLYQVHWIYKEDPSETHFDYHEHHIMHGLVSEGHIRPIDLNMLPEELFEL